MRVVTPRVLKDFAIKYPQSRIPLLHWYLSVKKSNWKDINDIKQDFNHVDYVGNSRYIFNIAGNEFRLIVIIIFLSSKIYIRFIGTHDEYNKINTKIV